ncbi:MAG: iron ABC transporter permease [Candidatus Aminicenantes bacterium]|jgi:iron complex transport system permease protein
MKKKLVGWLIWVVVLSGLLLVVGIVSLCIGTTAIPLKKILPLIFKIREGVEYSILVDIRLPRILLGFAVGGGLSLAGVLLQGMFRNPLVEPYTLGISGGAALGVCINIVLGFKSGIGGFSMPLSGFIGAAVVILAVYSLSARKGILKIHGLLLTGVMISFVASSFIMLMMAISRTEDLQGIVFWIMGSLEEPKWSLIQLVIGVSLLGLVLSYFLSVRLNALALGEEEARHLGINTETTKRFLFIIASLITGCCVAVTGIIGFVGLAVPHFVRMFVGQDHRILLISSFLSGAIFLIISDTIARTIIQPLELPVGVVTGIIGGIIFVYALTKRGVEL